MSRHEAICAIVKEFGPSTQPENVNAAIEALTALGITVEEIEESLSKAGFVLIGSPRSFMKQESS